MIFIPSSYFPVGLLTFISLKSILLMLSQSAAGMHVLVRVLPQVYIPSPHTAIWSCFLLQLSYHKPACFVMSVVQGVLCILSVTLKFKMAPKHSAEMLSIVPEGKTAVIGLTEKIHVG